MKHCYNLSLLLIAEITIVVLVIDLIGCSKYFILYAIGALTIAFVLVCFRFMYEFSDIIEEHNNDGEEVI